jgi:hypothetical protein
MKFFLCLSYFFRRLAGEKGPLEDPVLMEMSKEKEKSVAQVNVKYKCIILVKRIDRCDSQNPYI